MTKFFRIQLILLCSILIVPALAKEKPNIVIIYTDDVGWGDLSCYNEPGKAIVQTPNIDSLAETGIRFTSGYCSSATCTPSRYSLMTGTYAFRKRGTGILSGDAPLIIEPGSTTLATQMKAAGYATGMFGKWHLGIGDGNTDWNKAVKPGPLEIGFDDSFIITATPDRVPCVYLDGHYVAGLNPEKDEPLQVSYKGKIGDLPTGRTHPELLRYKGDGQHSDTIINRISRIGFMTGGDSAWWKDETMADVILDQTISFIEEYKDEKPFFVFMSLHQIHVPRAPDEKFIGKSKAGLYGDTLLELDDAVGRFLKKLEDLGVRDNTLIIFSADNGPIPYDGYYEDILDNLNGHDVNGPFQGGKYLPFEGGTRLPFIVNWPAKIKEPKVSDAIVSQVDFIHSLSELVGAPKPENGYEDSANILPALLGESDIGREYIIQQALRTLSIRYGDWKYISAANRSWTLNKHKDKRTPTYVESLPPTALLFNLAEDPGETNNLIGQMPEKAAELEAILDKVKAKEIQAGQF